MGTKFRWVKISCFCWNILIFEGFNFRGFVMGVIATPFSGLVVWWYSWISEQVMAKENNILSFSPVVSGWMKVTKERHSRACLAQWWCVFLRGHSLTKNFAGIFFAVWLVPSKTTKFNHPRKLCPYGITCTHIYTSYWFWCWKRHSKCLKRRSFVIAWRCLFASTCI